MPPKRVDPLEEPRAIGRALPEVTERPRRAAVAPLERLRRLADSMPAPSADMACGPAHSIRNVRRLDAESP